MGLQVFEVLTSLTELMTNKAKSKMKSHMFRCNYIKQQRHKENLGELKVTCTCTCTCIMRVCPLPGVSRLLWPRRFLSSLLCCFASRLWRRYSVSLNISTLLPLFGLYLRRMRIMRRMRSKRRMRRRGRRRSRWRRPCTCGWWSLSCRPHE